VKPFVEKHYRVETGPAHTFLGGSSLGGLISLEIARRHPGNFGGVIAMSPAIRWADEVFLTEVEQGTGGLAGARVWIDMGARENLPVAANEKQEAQNAQLVAAARRLDATLTKLRVKHSLLIDEEHAEHNEPAWASRFPQAITYILDAN
jgi:predicted alpha/beta superfamily hydrolase